jgi:hypothetical protein
MQRGVEPTSPARGQPIEIVAELSAVVRQSDMLRVSRRWDLTAKAAEIVIGTAPTCDWVIVAPGIAGRAYFLRWDGRSLLASGPSGSGLREELVVQPGTACGMGALELLLTAATSPRPSQRPPPYAARAGGRAASGELTRLMEPRPSVTSSEATVVIADPLLAARATQLGRATAIIRATRLVLVVVAFACVGEAATSQRVRALLWPTARPAPMPVLAIDRARVAPAAVVVAAASASVAVAPSPRPAVAASAKPVVLVASARRVTVAASAKPVAALPETAVVAVVAEPAVAARLATRVYAEPALGARGGCPATSSASAPSPEDQMMLQLAIEAYQTGRRSEAHLLFQTLACRPDVGPAARFMAHLLAPATAAMLPRDRALRARRLLDEVQRELAEHPELWAQSESLAGAELVNPKLNPYDFAGQPKCNIFIGEMLYRAGFVPPATPAAGQRLVAYPSVNQMVARARRLVAGESWDGNEGEQWFDVVAKERAQPGDLVLIAAKDRGDHLATEHGHVEIISRVSAADGAIVGLGTIGARSGGVKLSPTAGRVFGDIVEGGGYVLSEQAMIVRPRMR